MRRLAPLAALAGLAAFAAPAAAELRFDVRISGRKVGPRRWAGRFRGRLVVRRGGRVFDRCAVRGVRWRAVRPPR